MQNLRLKGKNPSLPKRATLWEFEEEVPEWLSDQAKVYIDDNSGKIKLFYRETSTSWEILDSSGTGVILKIPKNKKRGGVLYSKTHPLIYLTKIQLWLAYKNQTSPFS